MTRDMRMITYKKVVYIPGTVRNLPTMPVTALDAFQEFPGFISLDTFIELEGLRVWAWVDCVGVDWMVVCSFLGDSGRVGFGHTSCFCIVLARIRLLGRFTTCLAQTTTASRLLFALGWHFMPQECDFFGNFRV